MSETKWTPGPWRKRSMAGMRSFVEAPKANDMPYALEVLGDDYTGYGDDEQRERDVAFVAAAPDMYEALKGLLSAWKDMPQTGGNPVAIAAGLAAEAALAKAKGE